MSGVTMASMLEDEAHVLIACDRVGCNRSYRLTPTEAVARFGAHSTFANLRGRLRCRACGWLGADTRPDWGDIGARSDLLVALACHDRINTPRLADAYRAWDQRRPKDAPSPLADRAGAALAAQASDLAGAGTITSRSGKGR